MAPTLDNNLQTQLLEPGHQLQKPLKVHFNEATMEPSPPDSPIEDLRTDSPSEIKQASSESEMSSTDMPQESEGERPSKKPCTVCGEPTRGVYYGAVACLPCKTFFVRYSGEKTPMKCRTGKRTCDINEATRVSCKACRYAKCIRVGMKRKERPVRQLPCEGQQLCAVCRDVANGLHFGVFTCEGCKKFFRRGLDEHNTYKCKFGTSCKMNPRTRNLCRYCRFQRCIEVGMSLEGIRFGRRKKDKDEEGYIMSAGQEDMCMEPLQPQMEATQHFRPMDPTQNNNQHYQQNSSSLVGMLYEIPQYGSLQNENNQQDFHQMAKFHNSEIFQQSYHNGYQTPHGRSGSHEDMQVQNGENCFHQVQNAQNDNSKMTTGSNAIWQPIGDKIQEDRAVNFRPRPEVIRYWQNSVPLEVSSLTREQQVIITTTLELYQAQKLPFPIDPERPNITTLPALLALGDKGVDEGMLQNIVNFVVFSKALPGFSSIHQSDQCALIRAGSLETRILSSALFNSLSLDDTMQEAFMARDPAHAKFLKTTLNISKTIRLLNLDEIETCLLTVLCLIAADRPGLQDVDQIEQVRQKYTAVMASYIEDNHGDAFSRLSAIFSVMPRVRQIGQWYYELSGDIPVYLSESPPQGNPHSINEN